MWLILSYMMSYDGFFKHESLVHHLVFVWVLPHFLWNQQLEYLECMTQWPLDSPSMLRIEEINTLVFLVDVKVLSWCLPNLGGLLGSVSDEPFRRHVYLNVVWRHSKVCERWKRRNTFEERCLFMIELYMVYHISNIYIYNVILIDLIVSSED